MAYIKSLLGYLIYKIQLKYKDLSIKCTSNLSVLHLFSFFKLHTSSLSKVLVDLVMYDEPGFKNRFTLIYCFLSIHYNFRHYISIKTNKNKKIIYIL